MAALGSIVGGVLSLLGQEQSAKAAEAQGKAQQVEENFVAQQYRDEGVQAVAASQREMIAQQDKTKLAASRAVALASAYGGSADAPSVSKIVTDIEGRGSYNAAAALYQGEAEARKLNLHAAAADLQGEIDAETGMAQKSAGEMSALGSAFGMAAKYGGNSPSYNSTTQDPNTVGADISGDAAVD